jgi:glycosyltransferase involved in cell wall biosynthesis
MTAPVIDRPALWQRLHTVAPVLLETVPATDDDPFAAAGQLLDAVVRSVAEDPGNGRLWLLLIALTGEFPTHDDLMDVRRALELHQGAIAQHVLLDRCLAMIAAPEDTVAELDLITDRPVIDVDFSARNELMTGIQRVVRHTVPRWLEHHEFVLTAWTTSRTAMRRLDPPEMQRVVSFHDRADGSRGKQVEGSRPHRLVAPWHVPVILTEVPEPGHAERLAALGQHSGSPLGLIGYDCIPVVSADLVTQHDQEKFIAYLDVVKFASTVACISEPSAEEFAGFVDMVHPQALPGPRVVVCSLPTGAAAAPGGLPPVAANGPARVVCVGSIDRRKNQIMVLEAAERLWREGHMFSLHFLGSGGLPPADFTEWLEQLVASGRPITVASEVSDDDLTRAVGAARFTAFLSLHEGFGLPVAESLALGVPVLASNIGSVRSLADGHGGLVVDPNDADAVTTQMRRLLTDDALIDELRTLARAQPSRSWADYAADLWRLVVDGAV